jgi:hypothetical protein
MSKTLSRERKSRKKKSKIDRGCNNYSKKIRKKSVAKEKKRGKKERKR